MRGGGGGRSFSSRGGRDRDYGGGGGGGGGKFRGSNNSYRDGPSSGGRFNNNQGNRRFEDNNRNRSRYDRRSPDRFHGHNDRSSRNDSRDNSMARKRPRHEGNSGARRDFSGGSISDRHGRHYSNGDIDRNSKNRNNRRSPQPKSSPQSRHTAEKNSVHRAKERAPVTKTVRKFGGGKGGIARDVAETGARIRRSKLVSSVRSNIMRRRLANRNRDAVRRAKLMRSSLKKRDTAAAKRKAAAESDNGEKADKSKTDENDAKSDTEKDSEKKKSGVSKKSTAATDSANESEDKKETESTEEKPEADDGDEALVDKSTDNEDDEKKGDDKEKRKKFVRLWCVHCRIESATFKDYNNHIHSRSHKLVLGRYGLKQKTRLARMRLAQRNAQRQLEKDLKDAEKLTPQFCMLCRLNYRSPKEEHQTSEAHRKMKEFLMPYCETCSMSFKSPMSYEIHRCSVEHLRRKANKGEESDIEESEELQVDLENFLIVDSVGDVNGGEFECDENIGGGGGSSGGAGSVGGGSGAEVKPSSTDSSHAEINVGNEHVKKIEVLYCELCRYYLPHLEDPVAALQKHCSTRNHLRAYLRYKENQSLKITAEMIHRRDHKEKHPKKDSESTEPESKRSGSVAKTDDEMTTDKIWDDNDKDCDQPEQLTLENNEDEDDASVERYDRFKNSEKIEGEDDVSENDAEKDIDGKTDTDAAEQNGTESNI